MATGQNKPKKRLMSEDRISDANSPYGENIKNPRYMSNTKEKAGGMQPSGLP
jgi:hypothetical protein